MSNEVRTFLSSKAIGDLFTNADMVTYFGTKHINFSTQLKPLIRTGNVEDTTPEKGRCKIYRFALPLHGYQKPSTKPSMLINVTVQIKSVDELDGLVSEYTVIRAEEA